MKKELFNGIDFRRLASNDDFKEDSVREVVIVPMLKKLGYREESIIRSKTLRHPFLKIGSKKRAVNLVPDYILKVDNGYAWVLDAKSPKEKIINDENVEQVYSYACHPEIRSAYFALCNGIEFALYRTSYTDSPILYFNIEDIDKNWDKLRSVLSPASFHAGKEHVYVTEPATIYETDFDYKNRPLLKEIPVKKQAARRHFGVHGYFTRQSWNVVSEYIKNFTRPGDLVLDPYGGSGITAVEALMNGRRAINVDINPMAIFLTSALMMPVKQNELSQAFQEVKEEYLSKEPNTEEEIKKALKKYRSCLPKKLKLPKGSDVDTVDELFSDKQLAQLALLKSLIKKQKNENIRNTLLLMFSGLVTKSNLTVHSNENIAENKKAAGGFDAGPFKYYRYRIAPCPKIVDTIKYFEFSRFKKVSEAKKEMEYFINKRTVENAQIVKGTATDLSFIDNESVDYIYTDPPYGKKIPYLDLSAMWNAWLDLDVTEDDYKLEAIEGGSRQKNKKDYNNLMSQSIKEMYRVLKFDRWLSFVFAHKDPEFWHLIVDSAESCGFEYVGAVAQKNGHSTFKKIQHPFTVLSGQLIINFRKVRNPKTILRANLGMNMSEILIQTMEGIIAKNNGATLEQINDELIIKGLELGFLDLLKKEYSDLTPVLLENFDYDEQSEQFKIKKDNKFQTHIDVKLRIRYYLISYLRRIERDEKIATFDEIVLNILPLLKNGTTPEHQTILNVLKDIADRTGDDGWKLKQGGQLSLDGLLI
ncbi:MAG: type I restriction enzyme HsdR N-terminal domain-containing protein [Endomicrobium sp.]|nr:type I restriction enzyme HsdR N-terminal domain-containing protein [Endomicrobium sp.]